MVGFMANAAHNSKAAAQSCAIWGVLNVTPDSFSDGGRYFSVESALARGVELLREGADVIDIGGESSRPSGVTYGAGASKISAAEELERVVPVVKALVRDFAASVSVDTVKAEVADAAIRAGARIINDVSGNSSEALLHVVAEHDVELVLMHSRGNGEITAQNTSYSDIVKDVVGELDAQIKKAVAHGVSRARIWIDPGIGFAKTPAQSLELLRNTRAFVATGHRVLVGTSRKSFIGALIPNANGAKPEPTEREGGTAATVTLSVLDGAHAVRVHDVAMMRQAVRMAELLRDGVAT